MKEALASVIFHAVNYWYLCEEYFFQYQNVMRCFICIDPGWQEADQKSAKSIQTEGMDIKSLQTQV